MSPTLLCVTFLLSLIVAESVPVPLTPHHVSVEEALSRRRHAHHVAFVVLVAQRAGRQRLGDSALSKMPDVVHIGASPGAKEIGHGETSQSEAQPSEPQQGQTQMNETQKSDPKHSETPRSDPPQQSEPQKSETQLSEPPKSEPQKSELQQREPQHIEPQLSDPKQSDPKQSEPQQSESQQSKAPQSEEQQGDPRQTDVEPEQKAKSTNNAGLEQPPQAQAVQQDSSPLNQSLSKEPIQPSFNPSVSTVGIVGTIATVIVAAFLVWSKSSNNSLSPAQLASHAYRRVRSDAQHFNVSAQSSSDADGWNAGWDDDDEWNPDPPSAKV
ncbi:unnamed protein product [Agarophyton chilense]